MLEMENILGEKCESYLLYCFLIFELVYEVRRFMFLLVNVNFGV